MKSPSPLRVILWMIVGLGLAVAAPMPVKAQSSSQDPFFNLFGSSKPKKVRKNRSTGKSKSKTDKAAEAVPEAAPQGPLKIVVSIAHQRLAVYDSEGSVIATSPISSGRPDHPTPMGVFSVLEKQKMHFSNIYGGAPMPFMQRITWSGVAMHAGVLPGVPASHGCIRLPAAFAQKLFKITTPGTRVIVTRDEPAPVEIASDRLFSAGSILQVPSQVAEEMLTAWLPPLSPADVSRHAVEQHPEHADVNADPAEEAKRLAELTRKPTRQWPSMAAIDNQVATAVQLTETQRKRGPITVFVSGKESKVFIRQKGETLFDMPLVIKDSRQPLGTHVYTASRFEDGGRKVRWMVVSVPSSYKAEKKQKTLAKKKGKVSQQPEVTGAISHLPPADPVSVLERFEMPKEALQRISTLLSPGSTLIVSDNGVSYETGKGTDFIVLTR